MSQLNARVPGVVSASTGNHGQGMALAAQLFGRRAVVFAPHGSTERKLDAMRRLGAEVHVEGSTLDESGRLARAFAARENLPYIEDGEDREVLIGCATLALEAVEQLPQFDSMLVPVGGGNLAGACSLVLRVLRPRARMTGVQSERARAVYESWVQGVPLHVDQCDTFAGGLATSYPGGFTFPQLRAGLEHMLLVSDTQLRQAARVMLEETGHLPEGAGAASLAGLLAEPERYRGQQVLLLLTGSNFEPAIWSEITGAGPSLL